MLTLFNIYSFRLTDSCKAQRLVLTHWTHFCPQESHPSVRWLHRLHVFPSVLMVLLDRAGYLCPAAAVWKTECTIPNFHFLLRVWALLLQGIQGTLGQRICWHPGRSPWGAQVGAHGTRAVRGQSTLLPGASPVICFSAMFNRLCLVQGKPH